MGDSSASFHDVQWFVFIERRVVVGFRPSQTKIVHSDHGFDPRGEVVHALFVARHVSS